MNFEQPKVYAAQHICDIIKANSRSGGIFTALSDWILERDGIVYGCVLDDNFYAVHIRADNTEKRNCMRGSKYIQSKMGETYKNVEKDIMNGKNVLFSGTSCQVAGLRKYLKKDYDNLLCVDIVCYGVPSPKVWKEYLEWQEARNKSKVKLVNFRNKGDYGWRAHIETLIFENGKKVSSNVFSKLFHGRSILRPCCYECPYKSVMHPGDITIADYWGIEKAAPEFDDNKGVSLVLINNKVGERIFDKVKAQMRVKQTMLEDSMQPSLIAPFPKPSDREQFWKDFFDKNFDYIAKKYGGAGRINKLKSRLRKLKRKLVSN